MTAICIIPARGNSVRIPRKNIKLFHGKPIIAYSIEAARKTNFIEQVIVSTDDDEISDIAHQYGASVHRRPLCDGTMGTQEVTRMVLNHINPPRGLGVVCLYPCAPMITHVDLEWADMMVLLRPCSYVVAVATDPLRDIGAFYAGTVGQFQNKDPLYNVQTGIYIIPENRAIDINTPEDWVKAEKMYEALHA